MLAAGTRLGHFEVLARLGSGGKTCTARTIAISGGDVALEVLPEAFARDASRLARFEREARATAALNHPNGVGEHYSTSIANCQLPIG